MTGHGPGDHRTDLLTSAEMVMTTDTIAEIQLPTGMIPWFPGGHADPWNHVEAAMALALAGRRPEAERAYEWLVDTQHDDGSWCTYYLADGIEEARRDTNVCAYIATGVWHHYLLTGDDGFLVTLWPVVERAIEFVLSLQEASGELLWSLDADGTRGRYALLTGSSSASFSLRCAIAIAEHLGNERPEWELAAGRLAHTVAYREEAFEPKRRWAMDWYYPVLCGALTGEAARARIAERWQEFVLDGVGVRCVSDSHWVTAAETSELVMALDAIGMVEEAGALLGWTRHLRHTDGSYWTGCVHPQCVRFPGGERSTYTAAAVVLATHALTGTGPTAGLFRGEGLPTGLDLLVNDPVTEA
jgi:hypothetical protein